MTEPDVTVPPTENPTARDVLTLPPLSSLVGAVPPEAAPIPQPRDADAHVAEVAAAPAGPAADDASWATTFGDPTLGNRPLAVAVSGPTVYVGGDFTSAMAGMPTGTYNRIARWDGTGWHRMGEGVDGTVTAIVVRGGDVYVGGDFAVAGETVAAARLARWDGERWSAVNGGVGYGDAPWMAGVKALACDGTSLYVGGVFDRVGPDDVPVPARSVARLDLTTGQWHPLGDGIGNLGGPGEVRALLLAHGVLVVGGYFDTAGPHTTSSLASFDPATGTWQPYGTGITSDGYTGAVDSLALDPESGAVYVGGSFTAADTVAASGVVRLDGAEFRSMGSFTLFGQQSTASVKALACTGGRLYAGGEFTTAGNAAATNWAVHDGTAWSTPGDGVDNVVRALAAHQLGVVVLGDFVHSGSLRVTYGGIWTGERWESFGQGVSYDPYADGNVYAVSAVGDAAYVAGYFDQAGGRRVGSIARWTGTGWDALGGGVRVANGLGTVYALAQIGTDLYVAGTFAAAGEGNAANIARWDGATWHAVGSGLNGTAYALTVVGGRLYAGGAFTNAGMVGASGVAMWDPAAETWHGLGNAPLYDHSVLALAALYDRYLVIGGEFDALRVGNRDAIRGLNGMALFDTQAELDPADPLSGYLVMAGVERSRGTGRVRALQVLGGDLYVGGAFDTAGVLEWTTQPDPGFSAQNLAVWHVEAPDRPWSTPGGTDQPVQALTTLGARLLVGGHFRAAGPIAAGGVAAYDPATATWWTFGSGIGGGMRGVTHVEALAQNASSGLWVGGTFNTAGGTPSCSVALWTATAGED